MHLPRLGILSEMYFYEIKVNYTSNDNHKSLRKESNSLNQGVNSRE